MSSQNHLPESQEHKNQSLFDEQPAAAPLSNFLHNNKSQKRRVLGIGLNSLFQLTLVFSFVVGMLMFVALKRNYDLNANWTIKRENQPSNITQNHFNEEFAYPKFYRPGERTPAYRHGNAQPTIDL